MKREIVCPEGRRTLKRLFPTATPYTGEHVKFVDGTAKEDFFCDSCVPTHTILKGEPCTAFSAWADYGGIPYSPWEEEYLEVKE